MASRRFKAPLVMFAFGGGTCDRIVDFCSCFHLILHTGPNTIVQVKNAVNSNMHCWVVRGTGRFADFMAKLFKNPNMDILKDSDFQKLRDNDKEKTHNEFELVSMFRAICRSPLLHVFDLETDPFEALIADLEQRRLVRSHRKLLFYVVFMERQVPKTCCNCDIFRCKRNRASRDGQRLKLCRHPALQTQIEARIHSTNTTASQVVLLFF